MIPRIGNKVGELLEADIPGCYHLITGTAPTLDGADVLEFEFLPSYERVNGKLVPMSREAAHEAYLTRRTLHD